MVCAKLCVVVVDYVKFCACFYFILFFTFIQIILFCNLVCVYVHKICEDKFGGCMESFPWLGQKVNKKIDAYGHDADYSSVELCA